MRARFSGTGSYLPERVVTNEEICRRAPTTDEWIRTKLGIEERRYAAPDQQTSDLGAIAAKRALERARLTPEDLDGIICAVGAGDVITPATAAYIQHKIGAPKRSFAFDVKMACAGAIGGVMMARGLIEAGLAKHILIVGTHIISRTGLNPDDKYTAPIFGDGAGAVIVSATEETERGILASRLHTDGSLTHIVGQYSGGTVQPLTPENVRNGDHLLKMDGRAVWDCGVREVPAVIHEALEAAGKTVKDVDFVVSHQANKRLLFEILDRAGLKGCRTYTNVERYGNTVAASALIALDEVARQELVKPGELVLMCAIGAGMTWGAHVFRW
ncbi:MAG: ketoacyl-ACP synthase III [Myxococcota bacterium]